MVWEAALHQTNDLGCQIDSLAPQIDTHNAKRLMKSTEIAVIIKINTWKLVTADKCIHTTLSLSKRR